MSYTSLAEPFHIQFEKDGEEYAAQVTYVKSGSSCEIFYDVVIQNHEGFESFRLKEKPIRESGSDQIVWIDENNKIKILYQVIGNKIQKHLNRDLGVFLIDEPLADKEIEAAKD